MKHIIAVLLLCCLTLSILGCDQKPQWDNSIHKNPTYSGAIHTPKEDLFNYEDGTGIVTAACAYRKFALENPNNIYDSTKDSMTEAIYYRDEEHIYYCVKTNLQVIKNKSQLQIFISFSIFYYFGLFMNNYFITINTSQ